ncbi:MAG: hypothetical protein LC804_10940 [Acidobacteria bacterium]|nr:hypothetical protein [Acidobacteriota bacterium]
MGYAVGGVLALLVSGFARLAGLDRDRAFYPTILFVIASYYVLFAVIGGSMRTLIVESIVMSAFVLAAVAGPKRSLWLVVAGLAAHGVFDMFHAHIVHNPGVPEWWPAFCLTYDLGAAGFLAWLSSDFGRGIAYAKGAYEGLEACHLACHSRRCRFRPDLCEC